MTRLLYKTQTRFSKRLVIKGTTYRLYLMRSVTYILRIQLVVFNLSVQIITTVVNLTGAAYMWTTVNQLVMSYRGQQNCKMMGAANKQILF